MLEDLNPEIWQIVILGLCGILPALGGTQISSGIQGQKWIRRILLPTIVSIILFFVFHIELWRVMAFLISSIAVFSLGYGDNAPWFSFKKFWHGFVFPYESGYPKIFTALMMPLPILFIGWTPLILGYPFVFLGLFWVASKTKWKIFEFLAFCAWGALLVAAL